jgi:hypothetical protein
LTVRLFDGQGIVFAMFHIVDEDNDEKWFIGCDNTWYCELDNYKLAFTVALQE